MAESRLAFICGSGHSGSTLLDMLLGGHSQVSALGEAVFLHFNVNYHTPADVCTCGEHVTACPFWMSVEQAARKLRGQNEPVLPGLAVADHRLVEYRDEQGIITPRRPDEPARFRSRLNELVLVLGSPALRRAAAAVSREVRLHREICRNLHFLYDAVRESQGTPVVVDSTKTPGYLKGVWMERRRPMYFIWNIRDGRAVCHSRIRRENVSMEEAARQWVSEQAKRTLAAWNIPRSRIVRVRYEDLCADPERELTRVVGALGLSFEPAMLDFRRDRHNLGGNPMRHRSEERDIVLDERWKTESDPVDLTTFERVAGRWNRRLGYF